MNTLILEPTLRDLDYSLYNDEDRALVLDRRRDHKVGLMDQAQAWQQTLYRILHQCQQAKGTDPIHRIALTVAFGADCFNTAVAFNPKVFQKLERLVPQAPLHLPGVLQLCRCCQTVFPDIPLVLVFETAFFVGMPERERRYAIPSDMVDTMKITRYGYQGIYHEAACAMASQELRKQAGQGRSRLISLCLEPISELVAVKAHRVLMTTGGATPLEGILGETSCGTVDPSIVLTLSEKLGWGPEKINTVLTRESGLRGLTGKASTLETVLTSEATTCQLAAQIYQYRLLNACGAGIAALGGLDALVFSGRYATLGHRLGPYLTEKIDLALASQNDSIPFYILRESKALSIASRIGKLGLEQMTGAS